MQSPQTKTSKKEATPPAPKKETATVTAGNLAPAKESPEAVSEPSAYEIEKQRYAAEFKQSVNKTAANIKRQQPNEPTYGYWSAYGGYMASLEADELKQAYETRKQAAQSRLPEEYNATDRHVMGIRDESRPLGKLTAEHLSDILNDETGELPEIEDIVADTDDLQSLVHHLVLQGALSHSKEPDRGSPELTAAAKVLAEATKLIPGFNPYAAGLEQLGQHLVWQRAVIQIESPHRFYNRYGNGRFGNSDPVTYTVADAYRSLVDTVATYESAQLVKQPPAEAYNPDETDKELMAHIREAAGHIKQQLPEEPADGYWEMAGLTADEDTRLYQQNLERFRKAAIHRPSDEYTATDRYVLAEHFQMEGGYFGRIESKTSEVIDEVDLALGRKTGTLGNLEQLIKDTPDLEHLVGLHLLRRLSEYSSATQDAKAAINLSQAVAMMERAVKLVPDFNPHKAGFDILQERIIFQSALLQLENSRLKEQRAENLRSYGFDNAITTTFGCYKSVKNITQMLAGRPAAPQAN